MTYLAYFCVGVLCAYNVFQVALAVLSLWKSKPPQSTDLEVENVLVQLPIYNEKYVVENLIDCIAKLDYPWPLLEIQVLDDSDDETTALASQKVIEWQNKGLNIRHIKRPNRQGYKAGALAYGMGLSDAQVIAIFDADFRPDPSFLKNLLPYLKPNVAMVQSRWQHQNPNENLLTKLQAVALDAHFAIEQYSRNAHGLLLNFNGTAGLWRRAAIEEAGGWANNMLAEDLDLSFRAQLAGWRCTYVHDVVCPSILPAKMSAYAAQQLRWAKGAAECAKKLGKQVLFSGRLGLVQKTAALFQIFNSTQLLLVATLFVFSLLGLKLPTLVENAFRLNWVLLLVFYLVSLYRTKSLLNIWQLPLLTMLYSGLLVQNTIGVLEAWVGRRTAFVRTPKGLYAAKPSSRRWLTEVFFLAFIGVYYVGQRQMPPFFIVSVSLGVLVVVIGRLSS